jgi:hypothetical protein
MMPATGSYAVWLGNDAQLDCLRFANDFSLLPINDFHAATAIVEQE